MARCLRVLLLGLLAVMMMGAAQSCGPAGGAPPVLRIVVTLPPLAGLVRYLAPEGSDVRVLLKPGRSEHGFELTSADLNALAKSDLIVYVGLGLDNAKIDDFARRRPDDARVILSFAQAVGIEPESEQAHDHDHAHEHDHAHDHGEEVQGHGEAKEPGHEAQPAHGEPGHVHTEECEHDHGPIDPHLWLDPKLVEQLIPELRDAIKRALQNRDKLTPQREERLVTAAQELTEKVREVDALADQNLAPLAGRAVVTHHAAWGRLLEPYGLRVAAVIRQVESSEPTPAQIAAVLDAIRRENVRAIFVEPQFNSTVASRIGREAQVRVGHLDPLGNGDWFDMMRNNINIISDLLGSPK